MGPLIFSMALPAMISMIINALYNIVDSIFVAQYSQSALAAVSLVFPLQTLVVAIGVGTGVGVNSLIARRLGEKRRLHANSAAEHGVALAVIGGIVFLVLGFGLSGVFVRAFGAAEDVTVQAIQYSHIAVGLSIFVMISMMCEKLQQSTGNMIIPMCQGLTGAIINIILDPLMIFGIGPFPAMGIEGAALATGIGQCASMAAYLVCWKLQGLPMPLRLAGGDPGAGRLCARMYTVGVPAALNLALASLLVTVLNAILAAFSQTYVLILGVYYKLQTFLYLTANGIVQGIRPLMGYNYGAGEYRRVRQIFAASLGLILAVMAAGTALCFAIPEQLLGLFTPNAETVALGAHALRTIAVGFIVSGVSLAASGALEGLGKGVESLWISLCRYVVVILPLAFAFSRLWGADGVWHAFWVTEFLTAGIAWLIYRRATAFTRRS